MGQWRVARRHPTRPVSAADPRRRKNLGAPPVFAETRAGTIDYFRFDSKTTAACGSDGASPASPAAATNPTSPRTAARPGPCATPATSRSRKPRAPPAITACAPTAPPAPTAWSAARPPVGTPWPVSWCGPASAANRNSQPLQRRRKPSHEPRSHRARTLPQPPGFGRRGNGRRSAPHLLLGQYQGAPRLLLRRL